MKSLRHMDKGRIKLGRVVSLALCLGLISPALMGSQAWSRSDCAKNCPTTCPTQSQTLGTGATCPLSNMEGYTLAAQGITPAIQGRVLSVDVIEGNPQSYRNRIHNELVDRPAPQPGMTRASVEAIWGKSRTASLAPGKEVSLYVNDHELIDGYEVQRTLSPENIKVYEVTYTDSQDELPCANAKVVSVTPVMTPRVGDHQNMFNLLLYSQNSAPMYGFVDHKPNVAYYSIPHEKYSLYRDRTDNPFELVRVYTDTQGQVIGQEFVEGRLWLGTYAFTSAKRYDGI